MKKYSIPHNPISWHNLGSELVYTQTASGQYLSFYWEQGRDYNLSNEQVIGTFLEDVFTPVATEIYTQRIQRVIERRIPEQCHCLFEYQGQSLAFELIISPILPKTGKVNSVLVMGQLLLETQTDIMSISCLPTQPDNYQKLLSNIVHKIRRTLNLATIWQETVNSLGEILNISRCLLIYCDPQQKKLEIKAEYCQPPFQSILGQKLDLDSHLYLQQVISCREPVIVERIVNDICEEQSVLLLSTFYQNQRNGIICLQQCDYQRCWKKTEIELVQKLADQVGTAIAHATLYQELEQARKAAEEASRLKSEFLASTTHELRTPLNGIIGFLKLILDGLADDTQEQEEFVTQAYDSALHLLNLINDILDLAKIEAGKMELDLNAVSLNELFDDVDKFTRHQAEKKNLHFNIKLPATYDEIIVYSNYQRLLQVMLNLVTNSLKFTHEGGVFVSAEVNQKTVKKQDKEFPGIVKISVADTGIGVPLDKQDKLFQNFVQIDGSRTKAYSGTGLGLAISKKLIEAMGGQISFYSMGEGLGATVICTIPLYYVPVMKAVE